MLVYGFVYEQHDRMRGVFSRLVRYNYFYRDFETNDVYEAHDRTLLLDRYYMILNPMVLPIGRDACVV